MSSPDPVDLAVEVLREGGLVALPTETVYGLAADATNELAVRRIFAVKGRPQTHPLILHIPGPEQLGTWAVEVPEAATRLASAFWPGPLTLVLKKSARVSELITGGQPTVALRVPAHPMARAVLQRLGRPLAAPSANRFGRVSPTTAEHVRADLGREVDYVLDGGPCEVGVESTIVDLSGERPALLRPGGLPVEEVERVIGVRVEAPRVSAVRAPGTLASHYAPRAGVVLAEPKDAGALAESLLARGQQVAAIAPAELTLPPGVRRWEVPSDAAGFARALYGTMRAIDEAGVEVIVAVLPAETGMGRAVRDRLSRAAAPRG